MKTKHKRKRKRQSTPTRSQYTTFKQICNLIPQHLVPKLARLCGNDELERTFSSWSQVVALMFAHLTHAIGLNDVCDSLRMLGGLLATIRGATPPSRNNFSHANKHRDPSLAEDLYWQVMDHLQRLTPRFARGNPLRGYLRRFRRAISIIDSSTIQLILSCIDWAKHRRRKAAAKCHLRLDLQSLLPRFAIVASAGEHDSHRAPALCAGLQAGEIAIFDKAYLALAHLWDLTRHGVIWVTRAKEDMAYRIKKRLKSKDPRIVRDELVQLRVQASRQQYPELLRRIVARVVVDGQEREMVFLTNQFEWSAWTIAELYRCRWQIEVFFKEIKQTLQLCDFLGNSENAVRWQVWIGLLVHLLLRYLRFVHGWNHSFTRLFTVVRAALWQRWDLAELLRSYGTAGGSYRMLGRPEQAYLPGFAAAFS
jgi:hypothetical protein